MAVAPRHYGIIRSGAVTANVSVSSLAVAIQYSPILRAHKYVYDHKRKVSSLISLFYFASLGIIYDGLLSADYHWFMASELKLEDAGISSRARSDSLLLSRSESVKFFAREFMKRRESFVPIQDLLMTDVSLRIWFDCIVTYYINQRICYM